MAEPTNPKNPPGAGQPASGQARPRLVIPPGTEVLYSNVVRVAHSPAEMVFDFGRLLPGELDIIIKSRVLMSPLSAKLLQRALSENIAKYEKQFGEIKLPAGKSLADDLFKSIQSPDGEEPKS
ncbi:MAG: DUF3467 domain-containing protein [Anaerolineales bacterium]|nr:MAG: DUF3467 domain-containing protein [Anaerolineales bacterium]